MGYFHIFMTGMCERDVDDIAIGINTLLGKHTYSYDFP